MINVNEVKQYAEFLAKKWQSGGQMSPDEFNLTLPNVVRDIVRKYYGVPEEYRVGDPQSHISYEVTQLVKDYLSALKPVVTLTVDADGFAPLPDDYLHKSALRYRYATVSKVNKYKQAVADGVSKECNDTNTLQVAKDKIVNSETTWKWVPVRVLTDEQFDWEGASIVRTPTKEYPIARFEAGKIQFMPQDLGKVDFSYIRYPLKPVWGYTVATNGVATYDAATSVNIELPEICGSEVVMALLQKIGISIREPMLINWADKTRQMGS